jgi:hypothetical protein
MVIAVHGLEWADTSVVIARRVARLHDLRVPSLPLTKALPPGRNATRAGSGWFLAKRSGCAGDRVAVRRRAAMSHSVVVPS